MYKVDFTHFGAWLLVAVLLFTLCGCGSELGTSDTSDLPTADSDVQTTTGSGTTQSVSPQGGVSLSTMGGGKKTTTTGSGATQSVSSQGGVSLSTMGGGKKTTTTATTKPTAKPMGELQKKFFPNLAAWQMKGFPGRGDFTYQVQILGKRQYDRTLLEFTIEDMKLGDTGYIFPSNLFTAEWPSHCGYGNGLDGSIPTTRQQAADNVIAYLKKEMAQAGKGPYTSMDSFTRWQHYAAEAGYDYIGCEIGANVNAFQLSVAFTRGAAKQYNEKLGLGHADAWFVDFSLWNWTGMINYSGDESMHRHDDSFHANVVNHEYAGQSVSAARRAYYLAYMSGAYWLINEGGAESACYSMEYGMTGDDVFFDEDNGVYYLSPHGKMNQEFYDFTQRNPDRGATYVPFGVVIPRNHGLPYGHWMANDGNYKVFEKFAFTQGDWMIDRLFRLLYPGNYPNQNVRDDGKQQVNTPYGDTIDVLTDQAAETVLNSYPVIVLAGDVELTPSMVKKYTGYVQQGGTLVLNSVYTQSFPSAYRKSGTQGKGEVIVYGSDYQVAELDGIFRRLLKKQIPFEIDETVEYIVNVKDNSLVLTLINNEGVYKAYNTAEVVDGSKTKHVNITYTGTQKVTAVKDWMTGKKLSTSKSQSVELAPGGIAVIEFVL